MSRRKALLASSLTVCSASTSLAMNSNQSAVAHAEEQLQQTHPRLDQSTDVNQSLYQFLKPVSLNVVGAKAELLQRDKQEPLVYQVKKGDNLYRVGLYFGIHYEVLSAYNHLTNPDTLQAGQKLKIPIQTQWVTSKGKETVLQLAKKYRTTTMLMTDLNPFFRKQQTTRKGQWVLIPKKIKTMLHEKTKQQKMQPQNIKGTKRQKIVKFIRPSSQKNHSAFQWPVQGQITSKFGWRNGRQHKGIDIWSAARSRALIYAAKSGFVTRAGYSNGYGNLVVIDHGNGWVTYYAHLSRISVGKGQHVSSGEIVGNMGQTGNATGYHLHFEIRKHGEALNPLSILP